MKSNDEFILYIEDNKINRNVNLEIFHSLGMTNVLGPATKEELSEMIEQKKVFAAIIDYKLTDWVGVNHESPIELNGDTSIHDGIQMATKLRKIHPNIPIGLFSANYVSLQTAYEQHSNLDNLTLINLRGGNITERDQILPDFIREKFLTLKGKVRTLHDPLLPVPKEVQSFFARRLAKSINHGYFFWKAGPFEWEIAVECEFESTINNSQTTDNMPVHNFQISLHSTDFFPVQYSFGSISIDYNTSPDSIPISRPSAQDGEEKDLFLFDMLRVHLLFERLLRNHQSLTQYTAELLHLDPWAQLYGQKLLFRLKQNSKYKDMQIPSSSLPTIHSMDDGIVEKINDNEAIVRFKAVTGEMETSVEILDRELLENAGIDCQSRFEFTVYKPVDGSCAYQFEPL